MTTSQAQEFILSNVDKDYKMLNEKAVATHKCPILGVRMPVIRNVAKMVASNGDVEHFLKHYPWHYFEDIMLRGLVIGYHRGFNFEQQALYIEQWLDYASSWAQIDSVTSSLTISNYDRDKFWDFATSYLTSETECKVRFGVIALLYFFIDEKHIDKVLEIYTEIRTDLFYVKTGVSWGLCTCFFKFRDKTVAVFKSGEVDAKIQNLALQRIFVSNKATAADKVLVRTLKRRQVKDIY